MGDRFGWVVDGFSLGPLSGGAGDGEDDTHCQTSPFFMLYVIY